MSISAVYYRKADGVIFVFDVTKPKSFTDIETVWMQTVEAPEQLVLAVKIKDLFDVSLLLVFHFQWLSGCCEGAGG